VQVTLGVAQLGSSQEGASVVSVGVFDGVHLGHQAILRANRRRAAALGARATVVTFASHPKGVLLGHSPRTLTSLEHRLELFERAGIGRALVLVFDERLRRMTAAEFTRDVLVRGLGARAFVLGFDSKFGRDREGTPQWLQAQGLDVETVGQVVVGGRPVSSTAIREAVELGDLVAARAMLGRPCSVLGTVVAGDRVGRKLGFPTANLDLHQELHPPAGVYAGWAREISARADLAPASATRPPLVPRPIRAVANIGIRPTLPGAGLRPMTVEVHLIDFDGDLYGRELEFSFESLLRAERAFSGPAELTAAIAEDVARARASLAAQG
jgi:riboflavin kinase/FMN adenylyltransferase